jgi:hypothetical protein
VAQGDPETIGRVLFEAGAVVAGVGVASKAGKIDKLADAARMADKAGDAGRIVARGGPKLLSQFTKSTVDDVAASAGRLSPGGQIAEGARAIAKKLGHAQKGGYSSAFAGVKPTQANAEAIIRSTLQNPARTFYGDKVIDVYNAAGQGVRFDRATNTFRGFLEAGGAIQ